MVCGGPSHAAQLGCGDIIGGAETIGSLAGTGETALTGNLTTGGANTSTSYSGVISGKGSLTKEGSGTFTLSGINTNTGYTIVNEGTLQLSGGQAIADTGSVLLTSTGTLDVTADETIGRFQSNSATSSVTLGANTLTVERISNFLDDFAGVISGAGGSLILNNGSQRFTNDNTYTGATTFNNGTFSLLGNIATGAKGSIASTSVTANNAELTVSGSSLADTANVTLNGTSRLIVFFNGNETIGSLSGASTTVIFINGNGSLMLAGSVESIATPTTYAGIIGGQGQVLKTGADTVTLSGVNTYTGPTTVSGGTLALTGAGSLASAEAHVLSGGIRSTDGDALAASATVAVAGTLTTSGSENIATLNQTAGVIDGAGTIGVTGALTQSGGTTGGTVDINAATFTQSNGAIVATVTSAGLQTLSGGQILGALDGAGNVTVASGTTTVTGAGAISATTIGVVAGGTLSTDGGALAAGATVTNDGTLTLSGDETIASVIGSSASFINLNNAAKLTIGGSNASMTNAGIIAGNGGLIKNGSGTLILNAVNTYTGETVLNGGVLTNNGTIAGLTSVNSGKLGGSGSFGGIAANSGSIIAPGNSIGTMTVNGNVNFNSGSTYEVEIAPDGTSDHIAATGRATIAATNTTMNVIGKSTDAFPDTSPLYTVITAAGGVTGQFSNITDNLPDLDFTARYSGTTVELNYVKAGLVTTGTPQFTPQFTPKEIYSAGMVGAAGSSTLFTSMLNHRGSSFGVRTVNLGQQDALLAYGGTPEQQANNGPFGTMIDNNGSHPSSQNWLAWSSIIGADNSVKGTAGITGWDASSKGIAFGIERMTPDGLVLGASTAYSETSITSGTSHGAVDALHAGLYAEGSMNAFSWSTAVGYARQDFDYQRLITLGGGAGSSIARGATDGYSLSANGEVTYDVGKGFGISLPQGLRMGPIARLDTVYSSRNGFIETGAGVLNQTVGDVSYAQTVTGLGGGFDWQQNVSSNAISIDGRVMWEHVLGGNQAVAQSAIAGVQGATFTSVSAPEARDRIAVGLGFGFELSKSVSASIRYDGRFSNTSQEHQARATLGIKF